jgi:hypothetical protein
MIIVFFFLYFRSSFSENLRNAFSNKDADKNKTENAENAIKTRVGEVFLTEIRTVRYS